MGDLQVGIKWTFYCLFYIESREVPKSFYDMEMPPTTDKVWLHTGVIVCGCDIQSEPRESE